MGHFLFGDPRKSAHLRLQFRGSLGECRTTRSQCASDPCVFHRMGDRRLLLPSGHRRVRGTDSYVQGQQTQQFSPEQQDPDYNGEDFTRRQRSFDTRFTYISSGTTSQTDRESWLLRGNWKTDIANGWRLGLLAQLLVVNKTIFNSNDSVQDFGIGDTAFQAALIHDIDRHWAFGFGARLVAPTAEESLGSGKWQIMPGSGCATPSLKSGPTPISCLLFDTRSASPVILRDGISVNRRLHQH